MTFNDAVIVSAKGSDYRINFWYMSKDDAITIRKNSDLDEKSGLLYFLKKHKMGDKTTYYQKNKEKLLNEAKEYRANNKDCENKQEKIIQNYLTKKNVKKENMDEIDMKICLKKIKKRIPKKSL